MKAWLILQSPLALPKSAVPKEFWNCHTNCIALEGHLAERGQRSWTRELLPLFRPFPLLLPPSEALA